MRAWGALLLPLAGLLLALAALRERTGRAKALEEWGEALALWGRELSFRQPDTGDLLATLARQGPPGPAPVFARAEAGLGESPFEELWRQAVEEADSPLTPDDLELLAALGGVLGRWDREEQRRGVEEVRTQLLHRAGETRAALREEGRAYTVLGLSAGALAAIVLL